jgi:hypothetical protein
MTFFVRQIESNPNSSMKTPPLSPDSLFFVFDVESIGLHGLGFAVAGGVYQNGKPLREFSMHCGTLPDGGDEEDRAWVSANVSIVAESLDMLTPHALRDAFWKTWEAAKAEYPGITMAVECGWPVEARFLCACIEDDLAARKWSGPYPLHEIASIMFAAGMDPMATYERMPQELPAHEPLADARQSARLLATALSSLANLPKVTTYTKSYVSAEFGDTSAPLEFITLQAGNVEIAQLPLREIVHIVDDLREEIERYRMEHKPDTRHRFKPNRKYPWFCAFCGYPPEHPIMHLPDDQADRTEGG